MKMKIAVRTRRCRRGRVHPIRLETLEVRALLNATAEIGAGSSTSFSGASLSITGEVEYLYGKPYGPKDTAHVVYMLAEGVVDAAGARIVAYATNEDGVRFEMAARSNADGHWSLDGGNRTSDGVYRSALPDGVYTIEVQAFDDADHLESPLTTLATGFVVGTPPPPIFVRSRPLNAEAGADLDDVVVAAFHFIDSQWPPSFTPLILWGDGAWSDGRIVRNSADPFEYDVVASHSYAQSGAFTPAVILHYTSGPVDATYYSTNALAVAGGVVPGAANQRIQTLSGRVTAAEGAARIVAYATPANGGLPIFMGQAASGPGGYWTLPSDVPLPDGAYTIRVQAFDDADHLESPLTTLATGFVVDSYASSLTITGEVDPSYGPFPPPPGPVHGPMPLIRGTVDVESPRIEVYGTPEGGGAPVLFGTGETLDFGPTPGGYWWFYTPSLPLSVPDGVYTIRVQAFDDADHLESPLTTLATGFVVGSAQPPAPTSFVVDSNTLNATAGEAPIVVVATFTAPPGSSPADFDPLILWGDGAWSGGQVVVDPSDPSRFDVLSAHFYAQSGAYTPGVIVQPISGDWTANGYSGNALAIAGGFVDPRAQTLGVTNQRIQTLSGRVTAAEGAARIVAYATPANGGLPIFMGQAASGPGGYWTLPSDVPLPDGAYTIQVQAFNDSRQVGSALTTLATGFVVDTEGPQVVGVQFLPAQGRIVVTYADAGSGVDLVSSLDANAYAFSGGAIVSYSGAAPLPAGPRRASAVLGLDRPIRRGSFLFTIRSMDVRDFAGNPLQGGFDGRFPTRGAGDFAARLNVLNGRALRPLPVPSAPPLPRPISAPWSGLMRG